MLVKQDLKNAMELVSLFKNEMHKDMLSCSEDQLIKLRYMIDGLKRFYIRLDNESKSTSSELLDTLNNK